MNGNSDVAKHRFWSGCRNGDEFGLAWKRVYNLIIQIPKMPWRRFMKNFVVANSRLKFYVPVNETFTPIDQVIGKQSEEKPTNRFGTYVVKCES